MIIRHFEIKDIKTLQKYRYPEKNDLEILAMINEWNHGGCSGRYFEMFTAIHGGQPVGEISIHEYTKDSVSVGIHVFEPFRNKGIGANCLKFAIKRAKELNYDFAISLVDKGNVNGAGLFEKYGFIPESKFINPKDVTVVTYKKPLKI